MSDDTYITFPVPIFWDFLHNHPGFPMSNPFVGIDTVSDPSTNAMVYRVPVPNGNRKMGSFLFDVSRQQKKRSER